MTIDHSPPFRGMIIWSWREIDRDHATVAFCGGGDGPHGRTLAMVSR
jgi:hypothetical protein